MFTLTLTPNREQNTPIFARSVRYERKGNKVTRVERTRARVRTIPMLNRGESKDWTGIPSGKATQVVVAETNGARSPAYKSLWLEGFGSNATKGDMRTVNIKPTAKRDWLISQGYITPGKPLTQVKLKWVPGDRVYAEHDIETEEDYDAETGELYEIPSRRAIECADDCTEDESLVIMGGFFKVGA